jgi:hypothetical protein
MKPMIKNVLVLFLAIIVGGVVNMLLITVSPMVIPAPEGVDVTSPESLAESIHLFEPKHFIFPFIAHAAGTLIGAVLAFAFAASHNRQLAFAVGAFFLAGGITNAYLIPAPTWFIVLDLVVAYLPMAWLGTRLGQKLGERATG